MSDLGPDTPMLRFDPGRLAVVIVVEIEESRPRVTTTSRNPDETDRLLDWIAGKPTLHGLLQLGYALEAGGELVMHIDDDEEPDAS